VQSIKILGGQGQLLNSIKTFGNQTTINVQNLEPGIYYLKIELQEKTINKKFIKL
jgi:hypothetical protein